MIEEMLRDGHLWHRIARADWSDPLDPGFAAARGGRWNPPGSWPTLYLCEDVVTARANLRRFIDGWGYEPEDLRGDTGPHLAAATLPARQRVADVHSPDGVAAVGLPATYPYDSRGDLVDHTACQPIGEQVNAAGLRGVRCRSAQTPDGVGRELAWFPSPRGHATLADRKQFDDWYWA